MVPGVGLEPTRLATADFESQNYGFRQIVQVINPYFNWFSVVLGFSWSWTGCTKLHEITYLASQGKGLKKKPRQGPLTIIGNNYLIYDSSEPD